MLHRLEHGRGYGDIAHGPGEFQVVIPLIPQFPLQGPEQRLAYQGIMPGLYTIGLMALRQLDDILHDVVQRIQLFNNMIQYGR